MAVPSPVRDVKLVSNTLTLKQSAFLFYLIYLSVFIETYNALMKVAVVSANEEISATELAFGLIRDMMAAGLGKLQNIFP